MASETDCDLVPEDAGYGADESDEADGADDDEDRGTAILTLTRRNVPRSSNGMKEFGPPAVEGSVATKAGRSVDVLRDEVGRRICVGMNVVTCTNGRGRCAGAGRAIGLSPFAAPFASVIDETSLSDDECAFVSVLVAVAVVSCHDLPSRNTISPSRSLKVPRPWEP